MTSATLRTKTPFAHAKTAAEILVHDKPDPRLLEVLRVHLGASSGAGLLSVSESMCVRSLGSPLPQASRLILTQVP
jgi:hypothetical protein